MSAVSNPQINFMEDNGGGGGGSETDTNPEESPEYYEPITAGENDEDDSSDQNSDDDQEPTFHALPNGYAHCIENGVSSLDLSSDEDEEEERIRDASNSAIRRAFMEDESRRNARLPPENAVRVMEAMRGISFGGFPPDWASRIPEDQWLNQLRRIRRPPPPSSASPIGD